MNGSRNAECQMHSGAWSEAEEHTKGLGPNADTEHKHLDRAAKQEARGDGSNKRTPEWHKMISSCSISKRK
jgi:hypothetical protein